MCISPHSLFNDSQKHLIDQSQDMIIYQMNFVDFQSLAMFKSLFRQSQILLEAATKRRISATRSLIFKIFSRYYTTLHTHVRAGLHLLAWHQNSFSRHFLAPCPTNRQTISEHASQVLCTNMCVCVCMVYMYVLYVW
jgi:hypothetical protein